MPAVRRTLDGDGAACVEEPHAPNGQKSSAMGGRVAGRVKPMMRRRAAILFCALVTTVLALTPNSVNAFYDSRTIIPSNPTAADRIQFSIRAGGPYSILASGLTDRTVQIAGQLLIVTIRANPNPGQTVTYPATTTTFDLVPLPAGNYRLEVYRQLSGTIFTPSLVASVDLVVGQAPSQPVPSLSMFGALACFGLLAALGASAHRRVVWGPETRR